MTGKLPCHVFSYLRCISRYAKGSQTRDRKAFITTRVDPGEERQIRINV